MFDKGLEVMVFDPTPRAIEYLEKTAPKKDGFRFFPIGWWNTSTTLKFFAPRDNRHVSHSVVNLQRTDTYFEAEVAKVSDLAMQLGHKDIEIIKMDIEGAEHAVLADLIENGPLPPTLLVEFDQPSKISRTIATVRQLKDKGYRLRHIEEWNYTFTGFSEN
ncbi:MAG: FkbM family methyltransferase [Actinomycetia bacterium]|nr:FkbM family methyltransferase [Actinomycetes bacterium]